MHYKTIYNSIIANALKETRTRGQGFERHHITPRSKGGTNSDDNLVWLTPREHYLCHRLLWRDDPLDINNARSFIFMYNQASTARGYEDVKCRRRSEQSERIKKQWQDPAFRDKLKNRDMSWAKSEERNAELSRNRIMRSRDGVARFSCEGQTFSRVLEASEVLGIPSNTIRARIKSDSYPDWFKL